MHSAPLPANESQRLRRLRSLHVLDTKTEEAFDRIVATVATVFDAPLAAVSLVDADREWFKSVCGSEKRESPRDIAFCSHAILGREPLIVPDATADKRFADNPQVMRDGIRFYAGAPLITADGLAIGALCVKDHRPRSPQPWQIQVLESMARLCTNLLESRNWLDERLALAAALDSASDAIMIADCQGIVMSWNLGASRLFGFAAREAIARPIQAVIRCSAEFDLSGVLKQALSGSRVTRDVNCRTRDGAAINIELSVAPLHDGQNQTAGTILVVHDMTERTRAAARVRDSEARLRCFIETMPAAVAMLDNRMCYLSASRGWYQQYGLTGQAIIGRSHYDVFPEIRDEWKALHRRALNGEVLRRERDRFDRKDGSQSWLKWELQPWHDEQGRIGGIVMFTDDITEQMNSEQALRSARDAAEAASRAKSSFLANMSHELRTPLTSIIGYSELLQDDDLNAADLREHAGVIHQAGEHLMNVINDILCLSKIEAGRMTLETLEFSPADLLGEVVTILRPVAERKGVGLELTTPSGLPARVRSDPTRIRQVLMNLVGNGLKFTPAGSVRVSASFLAGTPGTLQFDVIDTGIGLSPEKAQQVFAPFVQGDSSMSRRFGGTGLGLTISRELAQLMGGDLTFESAPGKGSTFRFHIRCEAVAAASVVDCAGHATADPRLKGRILLAEDGPDNQRFLTLVLRKAGALVETADNGRVAVEKALNASQPFDLILMDMQMPEMDGYEAARALRAAGFRRPIVALTAHALAEQKNQCLKCGCDGVLSKPIARAALIRACANWMSVSPPDPMGAATGNDFIQKPW